jgi:hypothetical protein
MFYAEGSLEFYIEAGGRYNYRRILEVPLDFMEMWTCSNLTPSDGNGRTLVCGLHN